VATPAGDYAATLATVADLVRQLERRFGAAAGVGIGVPGSPSPKTGLIRNANSTWLNGKPLQRDFNEALQRRVRIANDADCFALSEAVDGAGSGATLVFGVILGTGVGGGVAIGQQLLQGVNGIVGEWGHNPLPWPDDSERLGPTCYCGRRGCVETYLSGPGLAADYRRVTGRSAAAPAIAAAAAAGDRAAETALERYEDRLARSLATVINLLDPEVIVLGGGLSKLHRLYRNVPQRWTSYVFSDVVGTTLLPPQHGDSSGVRGAAWLWPG
jgi:fructokinase